MAPLRVSTTKSEWLPDDPTAFVPTRLWKLPFITTWDDSRNQNRPTDSAEEALDRVTTPHVQERTCTAGRLFLDHQRHARPLVATDIPRVVHKHFGQSCVPDTSIRG